MNQNEKSLEQELNIVNYDLAALRKQYEKLYKEKEVLKKIVKLQNELL